VYFVQLFMHKYRDKKVVGVFVRFRAPLHVRDVHALHRCTPTDKKLNMLNLLWSIGSETNRRTMRLPGRRGPDWTRHSTGVDVYQFLCTHQNS
jgi:hypothetical protein